MSMKPQISEVLRAAASVRGARSLAVSTATSKAAPAVLLAAEAALQGMAAHAASLEPSAPSQSRELAWERACSAAADYQAAVDELRDALGLETHAATMAGEEVAPQEERGGEEAGGEEAADKAATEWAKDFAVALEATVSRYCGVPYDQNGKKVALIVRRRFATVGSEAWGDVETVETSRKAVLTAEDGSILAPGEFVTVQGNGDWVAYGDRLRRAGLNGAPRTPATSEWLPVPAKRPRQYKGDFDAEAAWKEAEKAASNPRKIPKGATEDPAPVFKNSPFAALSAMGQQQRSGK